MSGQSNYQLCNVCWTVVLIICGYLDCAGARLKLEGSQNIKSYNLVRHVRLKWLNAVLGTGIHLLHVSNISHTSAETEPLPHETRNLPTILGSQKVQYIEHNKINENTRKVVVGSRQLSVPNVIRRIYRRSPVMEKFHNVYSAFSQLLHVFMKLLSERVKHGTSHTLQNIKLITKIMPPDDFDIASRNVDNIIQKFFIIREVTLAVLNRMHPLVMEEYSEWFKKQSIILRWRLNMVGLITFSLRAHDIRPELSIAMETIRTSYADFSCELQDFLELLSQRYKQDTPLSLQHITLIPTVLKHDDTDFICENKNNVVKKFCMVENLTEIVLAKITPYIHEEFCDWFKEQSEMMVWKMKGITLSMAGLQTDDSSTYIAMLSAGVSGLNYGVHVGLSHDTLQKLNEVLKELQ